MRYWILSLVSCVAVATACARPQSAHNVSQLKIVGGHPTDEHRPWFVQLMTDASSRFGACGGTLIAPQIVMTAAHCIRGNNLHVALGMADGRNLHLKHPVKVRGIAVHPDYKPSTTEPGNSKNDIALLYLEDYSGVPFERPVQPLPINRNSASPEADSLTVRAVGLGNQSSFGRLFDRVIREADLPLVDVDLCAKKYDTVDATQICAGKWDQGGADTCQGDSGGPLVSLTATGGWSLVGVTSYGDSCAQRGSPGVYTRVSAFTTWIDQATDQLIRPRADQPSAADLTLLVKTHCFTQFGNIPVETQGSESNSLETLYSMDLNAFQLTAFGPSMDRGTSPMPVGDEVGACEFDDHGKFLRASFVRINNANGKPGNMVEVVLTVDAATYLSVPQPLLYQKDSLWCSTPRGNVTLVNRRSETLISITSKEYVLGEETSDPLPTQILSGCAVQDTSIEVFDLDPVENPDQLAARIHLRSVGTITRKLIPKKAKVLNVFGSLDWAGSTGGRFKIDNQSIDDIVTWKLECSAPFSLMLAGGQTLTSEATDLINWYGVTVDSPAYLDGTIKAGTSQEWTVRSRAAAGLSAKTCKVNGTLFISTSP
jgi:trypsin